MWAGCIFRTDHKNIALYRIINITLISEMLCLAIYTSKYVDLNVTDLVDKWLVAVVFVYFTLISVWLGWLVKSGSSSVNKGTILWTAGECCRRCLHSKSGARQTSCPGFNSLELTQSVADATKAGRYGGNCTWPAYICAARAPRALSRR